MGQTILDEYIANIEEDDDNNLPDPKPFGFSSIATMLSEAVEVMENQAESNSFFRAELAKAQQRIAELEKTSAVGVLQEQLRNSDMLLSMQGEQIDKLLKRIKELEETQQWKPVADGESFKDIEIALDGSVIDVSVMDYDGEPVAYRIVMPDDIRLCRLHLATQAPSAQKGEAK